MVHSLSCLAPALPLLLSATLFTSGTGKELTRVVPTQAAVAQEGGVAPLEFDPVASVCGAGKALALVSAEGERSSQLTCAVRPERDVAGSYSCLVYSWGWKCFYPDRYCFFFYTGGVYCYPYTDQYGW